MKIKTEKTHRHDSQFDKVNSSSEISYFFFKGDKNFSSIHIYLQYRFTFQILKFRNQLMKKNKK